MKKMLTALAVVTIVLTAGISSTHISGGETVIPYDKGETVN
ncbi:hypothetical protein [Bacillus sp. JCM 19041]